MKLVIFSFLPQRMFFYPNSLTLKFVQIPTLTVVTGRWGFVVRFRSPVAARAPPPIPGPASLPQRLVLLTVGHVALATKKHVDVHSMVTTSIHTMSGEKKMNDRVQWATQPGRTQLIPKWKNCKDSYEMTRSNCADKSKLGPSSFTSFYFWVFKIWDFAFAVEFQIMNS